MRRWMVAFVLAAVAGCREPVLSDIDGFFRDEASPCASCQAPAGEDHVCGTTTFCPECRYDVDANPHLCGQTRYCKECGREEVIGLRHDAGE